LADFKDERAYNSRTLTQWFLWSSLVLLVCVAIMAWKDYNRPWKYYQRRFVALQRSMIRDKYQQANSAIDWNQVKEMEAQLEEANDDLKASKSQIAQLDDKQARLSAQVFKVKSQYQMLKAHIDADKYTYSEENYHGDNVAKFKQHIDQEMAQAGALNERMFEMSDAVTQASNQVKDITAKRDDIQAKIDKIEKDRNSLREKFYALKPKFALFNWNTWGPCILYNIRNAPLLDFMAPSIQIKQVVLKNLPEDLYFAKTMRVDRCMSCHLGIDNKNFEDDGSNTIPRVFRAHPHLDLYVGSNSPHPMDKVGCTICHGGMGQALDFTTCAHVPDDEEEGKKWHKRFGWTMPEGVQSTMLPLKYAEGSCIKCHGTQEHINFAPKLNRGRELMVTRGCVGCHKVRNLEDTTKAGPDLLKVKGKLQKDFVRKWVWSPTSYNPAARMPSFFQQTNNSDDESLAKTKAELNSIVDLLYDRSEDYTPGPAPRGGSVANGKKLFHEIGCMACHGINDVTSYHADFAPDLSSVGSKLSPAFIYTWIKNPQHFNPNTRMPSLRLSDQEAADITAYLSSKKNKDFEETAPPEADPAVRDQLILSYLTPLNGEKGAQEQLNQMDDKARTLFLGEKSINKYGCFACHMIKGFENAQRIGTELSEWDSKQINQLDFGLIDIPHTHESFVNAKLQNPRQFDQDKLVAFQDRLKMPNFHLSDEDREAVATAVLGLTKTYVPDEMTAGIHGNGPLLEAGRRVISDFNCRGCHMIEANWGRSINEILTTGQGGRILQMYKTEGLDYTLGPPNLHTEGAKLQVEWFHDFLQNVHPIRPWLHIRMPSFHWTPEKLSKVITYFNLNDNQVFPFQSNEAEKLDASDYAEAKALFGKLQCQKCHILGSKSPADLSSAAPDLLQVHKRLKPDWVVLWLTNPNAIMPDTRMPGFWVDNANPAPEFFHGDPARQREALRDYLFMLGKGE
jgi:mono/diheme cytochrome c family protein